MDSIVKILKISAFALCFLLGPFSYAAVMGDGNPFNKEGTKLEIEDDRQLCQREDQVCKASGSFWCEDRVGDLVFAASGTVVDGELVYDPSVRKFEYVKWPLKGTIKFIAAGHNFTDNRKKYSSKPIPIGGTCYFYPKGNEPLKFKVNEGTQYTVKKRDFRVNENSLRAKVISRSPLWREGFSDEEDWMVGILDKDITQSKAAIINVSRDLLQQLADQGAEIKQYGYNSNYGTLNVAKKNTKLYATYNPSFLNRNLENIVLDCNDTNGGASGGASTITVLTKSNQFIEAVYAVRMGWYSFDGKEKSPGSICDPQKFANSARLISGDFYDSLKRGLE